MKEPKNIPAVSVGASVSVSWEDGKVVISVDLTTVSEALRDLVETGELTEEQEDFLSVQIAKGGVELGW